MIRQCFAANTGIRFHTSLLRQVGLDPASLYPIVKPRPSALYVSSLLADSPPIAKAVTTVATEDIHTTIPPESTHSVDVVPPSPLSAAPLLVSSSTATEQTLVNRADTKLSLAEILKKLASAPGMLTEEEEDLADALCPIYDQLEVAKGWWTLELVPMMQRYQKPNNEWVDALMYVSSFSDLQMSTRLMSCAALIWAAEGTCLRRLCLRRSMCIDPLTFGCRRRISCKAETEGRSRLTSRKQGIRQHRTGSIEGFIRRIASFERRKDGEICLPSSTEVLYSHIYITDI